MGWVSDFYMSFMSIMSLDTDFPDIDEMAGLVAAVKECGVENVEQLEGEAKATYYKARQLFHWRPQPLPTMVDPRWLDKIDSIWETTHKHSTPDTWDETHVEYSQKVALGLDELSVNPVAGQARLPTRASSRMWYYLTFCTGGMYLPSPRAIEHTAESLKSGSPGIAWVSMTFKLIRLQSARSA